MHCSTLYRLAILQLLLPLLLLQLLLPPQPLLLPLLSLLPLGPQSNVKYQFWNAILLACLSVASFLAICPSSHAFVMATCVAGKHRSMVLLTAVHAIFCVLQLAVKERDPNSYFASIQILFKKLSLPRVFVECGCTSHPQRGSTHDAKRDNRRPQWILKNLRFSLFNWVRRQRLENRIFFVDVTDAMTPSEECGLCWEDLTTYFASWQKALGARAVVTVVVVVVGSW